MSKKLMVVMCLLGIGVLAPVSAYAGGFWTVVGTIEAYEDYGVGPQVRITGDTGIGSHNRANCSQGTTRWALPVPGLTESQLEHLQRVLLSAHLAGSHVTLKLRDDQCTADGLRVYYAVSVPQ